MAKASKKPTRAKNPVEENIQHIAALERHGLRKRSLGERISDYIVRQVGTMPFILLHVLWFGVWIGWNVGLVPGVKPFDEFPFGLLTMVVSLEAIFLSLFILTSQNRITHQADERARLDLHVNMLAEQEMTVLLRMVDAISHKLGIEHPMMDKEIEQMEERTNVEMVAEHMEKAVERP